MEKTLMYFDLPGLAEGIRYIMYYTGQKFNDERLEYKPNTESWPVKEIKDRLPFGQFPLYKEGNRYLHQSIAIARYVAANTPLLPKAPWDQAVLDAAVLSLYDYHMQAIAAVLEKDTKRKEELTKILLDEKVDFFFSRFEKQIKENNGFVGKQLSWADFVFVGIIETSNMFFKMDITKNYPAITGMMNTIRNYPGVKEYIKDRKPYVF